MLKDKLRHIIIFKGSSKKKKKTKTVSNQVVSNVADRKELRSHTKLKAFIARREEDKRTDTRQKRMLVIARLFSFGGGQGSIRQSI